MNGAIVEITGKVRNVAGPATLSLTRNHGHLDLRIDQVSLTLHRPHRGEDDTTLRFEEDLSGSGSAGSLRVDDEGLVLEVFGDPVAFEASRSLCRRLRRLMATLDEEERSPWQAPDASAAARRTLCAPVEAELDLEIAAVGKRRRPYTAHEIAYLRATFFDHVDYDKVVITGRHFFSGFLKSGAMTLGDRIIYNRRVWRKEFTQPRDLALLGHETVHVWQAQRLDYHWTMALGEHLRYGRTVYQYDPCQFDRLTDYRFEQQGQIVQDYLLGWPVWCVNKPDNIARMIREAFPAS